MRYTKILLFSLILLLGTTFSFAAWQGTTWIVTGEPISSIKMKNNLDYLYSLWKRTLNNLYYTEGFVGIGTITPQASLHISSQYNDKIRLSGTQSAPHTIFIEGTQGLRVWDDTNGELLRITESGNVGIGSITPQAKLDVSGSIKVGGDTDLCSTTKEGVIRYSNVHKRLEVCDGTNWIPIGAKQNLGNIQTNWPDFLFCSIGNRQSVLYAAHMPFNDNLYYYVGFGFGNYIAFNSDGTYNSNVGWDGSNCINKSISQLINAGLALNWGDTYVSSSTTAITNSGWAILGSSMHSTVTGNVGIGVTNPLYKLDVAGDGRFSDSLTIGARLSVFGTTTISQLTPSRLVATDASKNLVSTIDEQGLESSILGVTNIFTNNDIITSTNIADEFLKNTGDTASGDYTFDAGTLFIDSVNNRVGIGTTTPVKKMHLVGGQVSIENFGVITDIGPINSDWSHFYTTAPAYYFNKGITVDTGLISSYNEDLQFQTSGTTRVTILNSNGNVGIGVNLPAEKLDVNGVVRATAFIYLSDERLKMDIQTVDGLQLINKLRGVEFKWRQTGEKSMGLIAQEVEKVAPELVRKDPNTGIKSVLYGNLIAPLIEAVKSLYVMLTDMNSILSQVVQENAQQNMEINMLKLRIKQQEQEIKYLRKQIESLINDSYVIQ